MTNGAFAASVTLAWKPNVDPVDGYKVYIGTNSGVYYASNVVVGATNVSNTHSNLPLNRYYFAATAFRNALESEFSVEVSLEFAPKAPAYLPVRIRGSKVKTSGKVIFR